MIMSGSSHRHYSSQSSNTIHHKVHTGIKVFNQHQVLHPEPTERDPAPTRHKFTIHPSPEKFTRQNPTHQAAAHQTEGPLLAPLLIIKNRRISALVSSVAFLFSSTCRLYSSNSLRVFSSASSVLWDFCFSTITSSWRSANLVFQLIAVPRAPFLWLWVLLSGLWAAHQCSSGRCCCYSWGAPWRRPLHLRLLHCLRQEAWP